VAHAAPTLLAIGALTGSSAGADVDLSALTGTLENGLPANILGGLGSGLTWAGGNTFLGLPDRGPNATAYGPQPSPLDNTVSYIARFQTVQMSLTPSASGLPFTLTPTLTGTTLLYSGQQLSYGAGGAGVGTEYNGKPLRAGAPPQNTANKFYFTGRSDNFAAGQNSGFPGNARLDPESIRVSNDGRSVFISDEYGPYIYQFDRATGQRIRSFTLPSNLYVATPNPVGKTETSTNTSGRTDNKGMEGLAITPDGKTLVGIMQAPLIQDPKKLLRIVTVDIATGATHEYAYELTDGSGVSDIVALNDHEFLVDERDGAGQGGDPGTPVKKVFKIDLAGATDVSGMSGTDAANHAVGKTLFMDVRAALNAGGVPDSEVPSKIEGLSFGQDVDVNGVIEHTLWVANDNDFTPDVSGDSRFFVFGFTASDLGGSLFAPQQVPEPAMAGLFGLGLLVLLPIARRRPIRHPFEGRRRGNALSSPALRCR
jgi:hypothetical protein